MGLVDRDYMRRPPSPRRERRGMRSWWQHWWFRVWCWCRDRRKPWGTVVHGG